MISFINLAIIGLRRTTRRSIGSIINWALADEDFKLDRLIAETGRIHDFHAGYASITLASDKIAFGATVAPTALGELSMDITTGRPSIYVGGAARSILGSHEVIQPGGSVAFTADQPMGGFTLTGLAAGTGAGEAVRYEQAILADGTNAFSAAQSMGGFKLTNLGTPTVGTDGVTKSYADALVSGLTWRDSVSVKDLVAYVSVTGLVGNLAASAVEALGAPSAGDSYLITTADGTGALSTATVGDIWEYSGTAWVKIITGSGGFAPSGTTIALSTTTALIAPFTDTTDDGRIAKYTGASNTPSFVLASARATGTSIWVTNDGSKDEGDVQEWSGTAWVQIVAGSGGFVPSGTRALASTAAVVGQVNGLLSSTDEGKIIEWDGTAIAPSAKTTSLDGWATLVSGETSQNENKQYVYDGVVPTGSWLQFGGTSIAHSSLSGLTTGDDHTQYVSLAGNSTRNTVTGQILMDGDFVTATNGGGVNMANGSLIVATNAGTPTNTTDGDMVWDSTNDLLYVGDGTSRKQMVDTTSAQTMTNKTLTAPTISAMSVSGTHTMTDDGFIQPTTDQQGTIGTATKRFKLMRAITITSGDHNFVHSERGVAWTMTEFEDGLYMVNRRTGKWFKMAMSPCAPRCPDSELASVDDELAAMCG